MSFSNIVIISPRGKLHQESSALRPCLRAQYTQVSTLDTCPIYTKQQLFDIKNMVKLNTRYGTIPFQTINLVRKYKINKYPSKLECNWASIKQIGT